MIYWLWIALAVFIFLTISIYLLSLLVSPAKMELKNTHVLITGGSSGIGKALAQEAVTRGAKVTLIARDKKKLDDTKKSLLSQVSDESRQEVVQVLSVDLCSDFKLVEAAIAEAEACLGPLDAVINCAGNALPGRFDEIPLSDFQKMIDLNYLSAVKTTKAVVPGMKARGRGRIVFVSSQAGQLGVYGYTAYSASKFALRGLSESLQMELKPYNIRITLSFPPDTDTPGLQEENKNKPKETVLISETSSLTEPHTVAKSILNDTEKGCFLSAVGMEGVMLNCLTCGFSPAVSPMEALQQVFFMGLFRAISLACLFHFNRIIQSCRTQPQCHNAKSDKKTC